MQLFAATIGGNQLMAKLRGRGFLIGSRQLLLQTYTWKVAKLFVAL